METKSSNKITDGKYDDVNVINSINMMIYKYDHINVINSINMTSNWKLRTERKRIKQKDERLERFPKIIGGKFGLREARIAKNNDDTYGQLVNYDIGTPFIWGENLKVVIIWDILSNTFHATAILFCRFQNRNPS